MVLKFRKNFLKLIEIDLFMNEVMDKLQIEMYINWEGIMLIENI